MSSLITSVPLLEEYLAGRNLTLEDCQLSYLRSMPLEYPLRLSQYYADLIVWRDVQDPLRLIAIPSKEETIIQNYELSDPIGDHAREAVPGLIHRYPDRALLLLTTHCRIHCRFCFRREVVGKGRPFNLEGIARYLQAHPEIKEIIFSGGDPFTFPPIFLEQILSRLTVSSHLERVRFHTRIPAIDPDFITPAYLDVLSRIKQQLIVVIHTDHPREVTDLMAQVVKKLRTANCLVLSQSVLLKNVNDSSPTLADLFQQLVGTGIKPYYLHHPDKVISTSHFRVSIERGKEIFQSLRGNLSSICLPEYVLDLPGGHGKIPVMWLNKMSPQTYQTLNFEGKTFTYEDPGKV